MQKIVTFLSFDTQAEEAARFYTSIFKDSSIGKIAYYTNAIPARAGTVMTVEFTIEGQEFVALNGAPVVEFSQAVSFYVKANTQPEIDELWEKLGDGGKILHCGWIVDKFGLTWQIVPPILIEMTTDPDPEKAQRVMLAMMKMKKIEIQPLKDAYEGK